MADIAYICRLYLSFRNEQMKRSFNILLIVFATLMAASCSDKAKSYTDMLNDQKKAIDRLIEDEGIEVLEDYPADGVFKPNQFVKLENDVYLNVIDSGNGQRATSYTTTLYTRFIAVNFMQDATEINNLTISGTDMVEFKYDLYESPIEADGYFSSLLGEGLNSPLAYVGDSSYVKLIVPFKRMGRGSIFQDKGLPVYFKKVRYIFAK